MEKHNNRIKASTYNNVQQKILYRLASDQEVQLSKKYRMWKESKLPNNVSLGKTVWDNTVTF
jgi:hypothetical protein